LKDAELKRVQEVCLFLLLELNFLICDGFQRLFMSLFCFAGIFQDFSGINGNIWHLICDFIYFYESFVLDTNKSCYTLIRVSNSSLNFQSHSVGAFYFFLCFAGIYFKIVQMDSFMLIMKLIYLFIIIVLIKCSFANLMLFASFLDYFSLFN
jgi:hypothetical protein